jgi:hypothetical protein
MQLDQGCKTQKAQHLDFTTNENGFVKRINTIFSHGWPTNNGDKKKKTPSDYHLLNQVAKQEIYQLGHFGNYPRFLAVSRYFVWKLAERAVG